MIIHAMQQPDGPVKERLMAVLGKGEEVSEAALSDGLAASGRARLGGLRSRKSRGFSRTGPRLPRPTSREPRSGKALRELTDFQLAPCTEHPHIVVQPRRCLAQPLVRTNVFDQTRL